MTAQEAYEYLRSMNISLARGNGKTRFFDAIEKAIEVLEKEIPKEPKIHSYPISRILDIPYVHANLICPNCNCCICEIDEQTEVNFCPNCGQAIKMWR